MKKRIMPENKQETYALITDITYTHVPAWYGETQRPLKLSLLLPKHKENHEKLPLLVWICGGAFKWMDRNIWIPQLCSYAGAGYVVASVEYRTSTEAPFPAALMDIKTALRFLRAHAGQYCIDKENITVMGESAGGTLACLAGVTADALEYDGGDWPEYAGAVHNVVDFYGLTDLQRNCIDKSAGNARVIEDFIADDIDGKGKAASVVHYITAEKKLPRFLILHGSADKLVPIRQSELLYEKLTACGQTADYYILEGAEHGADAFYQPDIVNRVLSWLKQQP